MSTGVFKLSVNIFFVFELIYIFCCVRKLKIVFISKRKLLSGVQLWDVSGVPLSKKYRQRLNQMDYRKQSYKESLTIKHKIHVLTMDMAKIHYQDIRAKIGTDQVVASKGQHVPSSEVIRSRFFISALVRRFWRLRDLRQLFPLFYIWNVLDAQVYMTIRIRMFFPSHDFVTNLAFKLEKGNGLSLRIHNEKEWRTRNHNGVIWGYW